MNARATIEEVASAAGVSRSTVSRVVNGSTAVSPEALDAVKAAISRLNYVPNRAARNLASNQTRAIALIIPEDTERFFGDPFFAAIIKGIAARVNRSDYVLNLMIVSEEARTKMTDFVRTGGVDGAIIVSHHESDRFVDELAQSLPVVFGGRPVQPRESDYVVDVDNVLGGRMAAEYVIARGRTRLAAVTGPLTMPAGLDRLTGFREAVAEAGLAPVAVFDGEFTEEGAVRATRAIVNTGGNPDAIVVSSDLMARGVLAVLKEVGLRVPEDVAVIGFDDSPVALMTDPQLTTVRQPMHAQGEAMADVLLDRLAGGSPPHTTILPTEVVVRASA